MPRYAVTVTFIVTATSAITAEQAVDNVITSGFNQRNTRAPLQELRAAEIGEIFGVPAVEMMDEDAALLPKDVM